MKLKDINNVRLAPHEDLSLNDLPGEEWIDCIGFDGYYAVSTLGRIKSSGRWVRTNGGGERWKPELILKQHVNKKGQCEVAFSVDGITTKIHTPIAVGMAFLGDCKENEVYCHKNKIGIDNRVTNLQIMTYSKSNKISWDLGIICDWGIGTASARAKEDYLKKFGIYENGVLVAKICTACMREIPIEDFSRKGEHNRYHKCKECIAKRDGVIDIGKQKREAELIKAGLQTCSVCKEIKSIDKDFPKNKHRTSGISKNCKVCNVKLHKLYIKNQNETIGDFYVKQWALRNFKIRAKTEEEINKYRLMIIQRNINNEIPKYFVDNQKFLNLSDFARYIEDKYNIKKDTTEARIRAGYTEEKCKLSEHDVKVISNTKGKIKITDTITKEIFIFEHTADSRIKKFISLGNIASKIKSGTPTRITKLSKHPNPIIIERI